jgi:hypothetical protein
MANVFVKVLFENNPRKKIPFLRQHSHKQELTFNKYMLIEPVKPAIVMA